MNDPRIIYSRIDGGVSIITPTIEALTLHGIDAIAKKDVPEGRPYKIVEASEVPSDRTMRDAWTVDDADLTDGVGAAGNTFEEVA